MPQIVLSNSVLHFCDAEWWGKRNEWMDGWMDGWMDERLSDAIGLNPALWLHQRRRQNEWCFRPQFCSVKLYWAGNNLGEWDEFCYESCPWRKQLVEISEMSTAKPCTILTCESVTVEWLTPLLNCIPSRLWCWFCLDEFVWSDTSDWCPLQLKHNSINNTVNHP